MAAEQLAEAGGPVDVFEAKATVARKFLRAGIGGLNLTHSDAPAAFINRYSRGREWLAPWLDDFDAEALRDWSRELGIETFVGSSGRVFPVQKKAAPLLRAWLRRLRNSGVNIHIRHRWQGWNDRGELCFDTPAGRKNLRASVVVLALGGGSWAALGSDGQWLPLLMQHGVACAAFEPSNMGFEVAWPAFLRGDHAGEALKNIGLSFTTCEGQRWARKGDALISEYGLEGGLIYAASAALRGLIQRDGHADIHWDLLPDMTAEALTEKWRAQRRSESLSNRLRKIGIKGSKLALLKALTSKAEMQAVDKTPSRLKQLPQRLSRWRPIDEAISTAGGVMSSALNEGLMLNARPGVFCAGEMLDWDAPTGGYLLTACFASGRVAGRAAAAYIAAQHRADEPLRR